MQGQFGNISKILITWQPTFDESIKIVNAVMEKVTKNMINFVQKQSHKIYNVINYI